MNLDGMANRMKIGLELLSEGHAFAIGNLRLSIDSPNCLTVTGWSQYTNFKYLNKTNSIRELSETKDLFCDLLNSYPDLKKFAENKEFKYVLSFDDYGKASINICSEKDGVIKWEIKLA